MKLVSSTTENLLDACVGSGTLIEVSSSLDNSPLWAHSDAHTENHSSRRSRQEISHSLWPPRSMPGTARGRHWRFLSQSDETDVFLSDPKLSRRPRRGTNNRRAAKEKKFGNRDILRDKLYKYRPFSYIHLEYIGKVKWFEERVGIVDRFRFGRSENHV
jgi:hypothetical protein